MNDNLPINKQGIDDDENLEPILPTTHEEVFQNLQENGENQNFLEREANKAGVDFDADTMDEFNRKINEE